MANQVELKDQAVTLYLDGLAHIVTLAELPPGHENNVLLTGLTNDLDIASVHTALGSRDTEILEARVLEPTTIEDILKGQSCQIGDNPKTVGSFTLINIESGIALLYDGSSNTRVIPLKSGIISTDNIEPASVRSEKSLQLKLGNIPTNNKLYLSYLTSGISITPNYTLTLIGDKLVLAADVGIENKTGREFKDVVLTVIPGEVNMPYLPRSHRGHGYASFGGGAVFGMHAMVDGVEATEDEGQISYRFGTRNLSAGNSKFSMFKTRELDYAVKYQATLGGHRKTGISTTLTFKAPDTLTVGQAAVYRERECVETYEGGGTINNTLKDQDVSIALRTPDTLELKVEQQGKTEILNTDKGTPEKPLYALQRTYVVTAKNAGKEDVTIETYLGLNEFQSILESDLPQHEQSSGKRARWDINVKAGSQSTVTYKVQELCITPMDENEVRKQLNRTK